MGIALAENAWLEINFKQLYLGLVSWVVEEEMIT